MSTGGHNTKFVVLALGIVVAVGAISYFGGFYPPSTDESTGAIGAAKRYRTEQMTDRDVVLGDSEVAAFMQTDTFDRIMKDDTARKLLASPEFQAAMQNGAMTDLLAKEGTRKILENAGLVSLISSLEASGAKRFQDSADAELFAAIVESAGKGGKDPLFDDVSSKVRRDVLVAAAESRIREANGNGGLSLLNDVDFRKAIVAIGEDVKSGVVNTDAEARGRKPIYTESNAENKMAIDAEARGRKPVFDTGSAAGKMAIDAGAHGRRPSIITEALGRVHMKNDAWSRELDRNSELRSVVLAGLEAGAFSAQFDASSAGKNDTRVLDAAAKVFRATLSHEKFDRLMADGAAMKKIFDAADTKGEASLVVELAAAAQTDAAWGVLFNETAARKGKGPIVSDPGAMADVALLYDLAGRGGGGKVVRDLHAVVMADAAGGGKLMATLESNAMAPKYFTNANVLKTARSEEGGD